MQLWLGAVPSRFDAGPIAVRRGSTGRVIATEVGWRSTRSAVKSTNTLGYRRREEALALVTS
jgi:hypothetical protein